MVLQIQIGALDVVLRGVVLQHVAGSFGLHKRVFFFHLGLWCFCSGCGALFRCLILLFRCWCGLAGYDVSKPVA